MLTLILLKKHLPSLSLRCCAGFLAASVLSSSGLRAQTEELSGAEVQSGDPVVQEDLRRDGNLPNYATRWLAPETAQTPDGPITYSVTFVDPGGTYSSYYPALTANLKAAGAIWSRFFAKAGSIEVQIEITTATTRVDGASATSGFVRNDGTRDIFEQGAAYELRTGIDPNGTTPDVNIRINPNYLTGTLWLDPQPTKRTAPIPATHIDVMSIFLHELGHAFAFTGWINGTTGELPATYMSTFDERVNFNGTNFFFNGPQAQLAYGAPVSITYGNPGHLGNNAPRPGSDLLPDLMNGVVYYYQHRYYVSAIDLGIMQDCGLAVRRPISDFNRDGFTDFVLFKSGTRGTTIWNLQDNQLLNSTVGPVLPAGTVVAAVADLNRDATPDYVLFNASTRQTTIWFMENNVHVSSAAGPIVPAGWEIISAVDMNNNAKPDLILANASTRKTSIWYLNGATVSSKVAGPMLPVGWSLGAVIDFNANTKPDFVLVDPATRQTAIWYLNGANFVNAVAGPTLPAGWTLRGAADFNGDGNPDYVLFRASTRHTSIWYLNGATLSGTAAGPTLPAGNILVSP